MATDMLRGSFRRQCAAILCGSRMPLMLVVVLWLFQLAVMKNEAHKTASARISVLWIRRASLTFIQVRVKAGL